MRLNIYLPSLQFKIKTEVVNDFDSLRVPSENSSREIIDLTLDDSDEDEDVVMPPAPSLTFTSCPSDVPALSSKPAADFSRASVPRGDFLYIYFFFFSDVAHNE